jgi:hypothetical protein
LRSVTSYAFICRIDSQSHLSIKTKIPETLGLCSQKLIFPVSESGIGNHSNKVLEMVSYKETKVFEKVLVKSEA